MQRLTDNEDLWEACPDGLDHGRIGRPEYALSHAVHAVDLAVLDEDDGWLGWEGYAGDVAGAQLAFDADLLLTRCAVCRLVAGDPRQVMDVTERRVEAVARLTH